MALPRFTLLLYLPGQPPRQVVLDHDLYRLGRGTDNDITLTGDGVSRYHARIERRGEAWEYTNLDSTNGTYVDGQRVRQTVLRDGMRLQLGNKPEQGAMLTFQAAAQKPRLREDAADAGLTIRQYKEPTTDLIPLKSYQPVAMLVVQENGMTTVKETVTKSVTITPEAVDVATPHKFTLNYTRSASHLLGDWGMLLGLSLLFGGGTIWVMKKKDVV